MVLSPDVLGFGRVLVGVGKRDGTGREVEAGLAVLVAEEGLEPVELKEGRVLVEVNEGLAVLEVKDGLEVAERLPGVDGLEEVTEAELVFRTEVLLLLLLLEKELPEYMLETEGRVTELLRTGLLEWPFSV